MSESSQLERLGENVKTCNSCSKVREKCGQLREDLLETDDPHCLQLKSNCISIN